MDASTWRAIASWSAESVHSHPWARHGVLVRTELKGGDVAHSGGQVQRQDVEVGTSGVHVPHGELVPVRDDDDSVGAGEDAVAVKRERVEQLLGLEAEAEEEEEEEEEEEAKRQRETVLGKRRELADEEAERGRPCHRTQPLCRQPLLAENVEAEHQHQGEGENISTPAPAAGSAVKEPATIRRPGRPKKVMPALSLPQPFNTCSRCISFGITCQPNPGYACHPCCRQKKGCEHATHHKRGQSASQPPPPPPTTAPPSPTTTPARGRSSTRAQTRASSPASPSWSEPPTKQQHRQSNPWEVTAMKMPAKSTRRASPRRRSVMHGIKSDLPPGDLPTVFILRLNTNGWCTLGVTNRLLTINIIARNTLTVKIPPLKRNGE